MWEVLLGIVLTYVFAMFCPDKFQRSVNYIKSFYEPQCNHDDKKKDWRSR